MTTQHNTSHSAQLSRRGFLGGTLAVGLAGGLGACGGTAGGGGAGGGLVGFAQKNMGFFFFVVEAEAVKRAVKKLEYQYTLTNAKGSSSQQFQQLQNMLVKNPAFIVTDPIDSKGLIPAVEDAKRKDVPVGVIDTPLSGGPVDFTVAFDNEKAGTLAGKRVVELLKKKNGTAKGRVLNAYGPLESQAWALRKKGFESVIKQHPDIQLLARPTDGSEQKARSVGTSTLSQYPDLDAMHTPSASLTRGLINALQASGKTAKVGEPEHVIVASIDGEPMELDWIRDGLLNFTVSQDPVAYGQICVEMLDKYSVRGKKVPLKTYKNPEQYYWAAAPIEKSDAGPRMTIPPFTVDKDNVDDDRLWGNVTVEQWGMTP